MRGRRPPPWALAALGGLLYLLAAPATTDLAAQVHRTALARRDVWLVDLSWFGGHHLPSYSVLSPLLGRWLGPTLLGTLAAVIAAWAFGRVVARAWPGTRGTVAAWWFAGGVAALLFTGRITFVLGAAVALTALVAAAPARRGATGPRWRRPLAGGVGGVLTALASPVAALFLALVAVAWGLSVAGRERVAPLVTAACAFAAAAGLSAAFPGGGTEPFAASALWPAVAVLVAVLLVLPADERGLRIGVALYLTGILLAAALPTPMGGNATRLAALAGGPLLVAALWDRRPLALLLLALPFLYWQLYPPVRDATQASGDPSARAAYWRPVADQLRTRLRAEPGRVEVPPTARRGEARWLSPDVPLARGWIRQLDRHRNALFYRPGLTPAAYRRWLDDEAVAWIALPDAPADHASRAELELLRGGRVPGLRRVWGDAHWSLWRVVGARPLAGWSDVERSAGVAVRPGPQPRTIALGPDRITVAVPAPGGTLDLRIRWSRYLRIVHGRGCLRRGTDGWTRVAVADPGTITVGAGLPGPWRPPATLPCGP